MLLTESIMYVVESDEVQPLGFVENAQNHPRIDWMVQMGYKRMLWRSFKPVSASIPSENLVYGVKFNEDWIYRFDDNKTYILNSEKSYREGTKDLLPYRLYTDNHNSSNCLFLFKLANQIYIHVVSGKKNYLHFWFCLQAVLVFL